MHAPNNGGVFYTTMRQCETSGVCTLIQPYGLFQGQGVTLSQLNSLHLGLMAAATLALLPNGDGIMASKIYLGGISERNFGLQLGLFVGDSDKLVSAITPGAIALIKPADEMAGADAAQIGFDVALSGSVVVNAVGAHAPSFLTPEVGKILNGVVKPGHD